MQIKANLIRSCKNMLKIFFYIKFFKNSLFYYECKSVESKILISERINNIYVK